MSPYVMPGIKDVSIKLVAPIKKQPIDRILNIVTEEFDVTVSEIVGKTRDRRIVEARQVICHIMVVRMRLTLKYTGINALGGRDHTTVIHSIKMFNNMYETDEEYRRRADKAIDRFNI